MVETDAGRNQRRLAALLRERLRASGILLGAAALLLAAMVLFAGLDWRAAAASIAILLALAAFAPPRWPRRMQSPQPREALGLDGLSAYDLAGALADPLVIFDGNGSVVFANHAAHEAFGQMPEGLLLQLRFRAPEMQEMIAGVLAAAQPIGVAEYSERVPIERNYRVVATPLGPRTNLYMLAFRNQSELRRIDRMRADFIANASHELRTPLASIAGFIETLRGPARDDAAARETFLQIMQQQTGRMARLIDDLLSLSRLEMKPLLRSADKIEIGALVAEVAEALRHTADEYGVAIRLDPPPTPILVPGSRDELTQVFENLIENACKYGHDGKRVEISFASHGGGPRPEVAVTVRDFGAGIPEEHIPRVTERFYRVDSGTGRAQKGTGLGLAIVKHILTRHEGRLSIRSAPGEGAAFTVHLPTG